MHFLAFRIKRAHHGTLLLSRPLAETHGLTPARFDLLYVIKRRTSCVSPSVSQVFVRRSLGVASSTVSRMMRSLEELGFITREPHPYDGRQRMVRLTPWGLDRMRRAIRAHVRKIRLSAIQRVYESAFGPRSGAAFAKVFELGKLLDQIRRRFVDTAAVPYPMVPPRPRGASQRTGQPLQRRVGPTSTCTNQSCSSV